MASFFPTSRFPGSALVYRAKAFLTLSMGLASASSVAFSQDSTPIIPPIVPIYGQESPTPSNPPEEESNPAPKDSASMDTGKTEEVPATTEIPPVIPLLPNLELEFESPSESGSVTESGLDQEALDRFDTATSQEQLELLHLYAEYGNSAMVDALSQKFLERNPGDPAANEIMATFAIKNRHPKEAMFYTEQLMAVNPSTKAKVLRASALSLAKRPAEAVPILQRLKAENKEEIFPQQVDLSFALLESGRTDAAKSAFEEIVNTPGYSPDIVAEAESQLAGIHFNQLVAHGDRAIENDDLETAREISPSHFF